MNINIILEAWKREYEQMENSACNLCDHGVSVGYKRYCKLDRPNAPQPVAMKRAPGGSCGPEALHLSIESHNRTFMRHAHGTLSDN